MSLPTLASVLAGNLKLTASCNDCPHSQDLDLPPLIEKLGGGFKAIDLDGRLACSRCGSRDVETRMVPRTTPKFW